MSGEAARPLRVEVERPRCPYCHDPIEASARKTGCETCMAWHHRECWEEHAGCSACAGTVRLATSPTATELQKLPAPAPTERSGGPSGRGSPDELPLWRHLVGAAALVAALALPLGVIIAARSGQSAIVVLALVVAVGVGTPLLLLTSLFRQEPGPAAPGATPTSPPLE